MFVILYYFVLFSFSYRSRRREKSWKLLKLQILLFFLYKLNATICMGGGLVTMRKMWPNPHHSCFSLTIPRVQFNTVRVACATTERWKQLRKKPGMGIIYCFKNKPEAGKAALWLKNIDQPLLDSVEKTHLLLVLPIILQYIQNPAASVPNITPTLLDYILCILC